MTNTQKTPNTIKTTDEHTDEYMDITLPSGRKGQVLKHLKGKHQRLAGRIAAAEAGDNEISDDPTSIYFSLIAVTCKIDGQKLNFADVEDLYIEDIDALQTALNAKKDFASA